MEKEIADRIYDECMNMSVTEFLDTISKTQDEEKKSFFVELFNYVLKKRQQECINNGVY